jgi:hypothetical protein
MPGIFGVLAKRPDLPPRELGHLGRRILTVETFLRQVADLPWPER